MATKKSDQIAHSAQRAGIKGWDFTKNQSTEHAPVSFEIWSTNLNKNNKVWYDKIIALQTSIEEAVIASTFIYLWNKFKKHDADGIFIIPKEFEKHTAITSYALRKVLNRWESLEIIVTKCKGIPLKKYYWLDEGRFAEYLNEIYDSYHFAHPIEIDRICCRNRKGYVNENDKIINKSKLIKKKNNDGNPSCSTAATLQVESDPFYEKCAICINNIVRKHKDMRHRHYTSTWSKVFVQIVHTDGIKKRTVRQTLKWYKQHYGEKFVPRIYIISDLRNKFPRIIAAMERHIKENPIQEQLPLSQTAEKIVRHLLDNHFPKASSADLGQAVEQSIIQYKLFRKYHRAYIVKEQVKVDRYEQQHNIKSSRVSAELKFAQYFEKHLEGPTEFIRNWFNRIARRYRNWSDWSGNLDKCIFDINNKQFIEFGTDISRQYGSEKKWTKYHTTITKLMD